ncbi:MAG TPA: GGDEF domain-containing protein [Lacipirellula sp.]
MDYLEDFERAVQLAKAAIDFLRDRKHPPHPRNFTLLYAYFADKSPALRRELDQALAAGVPLTADLLVSLYDKHFGIDFETQVIRDASETIESTLSRLLSYMDEAKRDTHNYDQALQEFSGRVDHNAVHNGGIEELRAAVVTILAETQKMRANTRRLEERFSAANSKIGELRQSLDQMRQEALTDSLTGIANRKCFDMRLRELMAEANEEGKPLALLMVDIDHFKKFNDNFGHLIGDQVLKLVARTLTDCVRGQDVAARFGGEEFAIILPNTNLDGAYVVAENIRANVAAKKITRKSTGDSLGHITLSLGIAMFRPGESVAQLLKRADEGLYIAKGSGRNRTSSAERLGTLPQSA